MSALYIYVVAFTGGYDAPSYEVKSNEDDAWNVAEEWIADMEEGDTVDVLKINLSTFRIERLDENRVPV